VVEGQFLSGERLALERKYRAVEVLCLTVQVARHLVGPPGLGERQKTRHHRPPGHWGSPQPKPLQDSLVPIWGVTRPLATSRARQVRAVPLGGVPESARVKATAVPAAAEGRLSGESD